MRMFVWNLKNYAGEDKYDIEKSILQCIVTASPPKKTTENVFCDKISMGVCNFKQGSV